MRTTLSLDDDVLEAARCLAAMRGIPLGTVVSGLARRGLRSGEKAADTRNGIRLFPVRRGATKVTPEIVKTLLEGVS